MNLWLPLGLTAFVLLTIAILVISAFKVYSLTKVVRVPIEQDPGGLGLRYENVSFPSNIDGLILRGWYIPAGNSKECIIMVHGGEEHRADGTIKMLDIAMGLTNHNYNVLMFDLRGHGESAGARFSAGYLEKRDLMGAIDYLKRRSIETRHIGLLGFSLGAATALLVAAEDKEISAVVADSSFADIKGLLEQEIPKRSGLPKLFSPIISLMTRIIHGAMLREANPIAAAPMIAPRPVLFIHGERDDVVPVEHARWLHHAANNPQNELWVVPGTEHVKSYATHPEEYLTKIAAFFDRALRESESR